MLKTFIKRNSYYDSATLMMLTSKIGEEMGSTKNVAVMMGTDMNKDIMEASGLLDETGRGAGANDLVIALKVETDEAFEEALVTIDKELNKKVESAGKESDVVATMDGAFDMDPELNLAVVSLPGLYAAREAKNLLNKGANVLLFSDNVSIDQENELKELALEKGLLLMGPDCGTAVINGVGLGFANKLKKGNIGIVAASGTGLQEVMCQISNRGGGVSQAIGTGGRDVKEAIGGKMMLFALQLLLEDQQTDVVVIVSKPPADSVLEKISKALKNKPADKKVILCFMGHSDLVIEGCETAETLEEAAMMAVKASGRGNDKEINVDLTPALAFKEEKAADQKYIRALYCGGTLAYESMLMMKKAYGTVYSNVALTKEEKMDGKMASKEHTVLDLGDDEFTVGKPHPMIEPSLRGDRLMEEAADKSVAVIVCDVELGYGSHENPASILAKEVKAAKEMLEKEGRKILFIANILGTYEDFQGFEAQKKILQDAGMIVTESNAQAIRLAMAAV